MSTTTVMSFDVFAATSAAQDADGSLRAFFEAVNANAQARIDDPVHRGSVFYGLDGTRSQTGSKRYPDCLPPSRSVG
jgi:hypothetical protein